MIVLPMGSGRGFGYAGGKCLHWLGVARGTFDVEIGQFGGAKLGSLAD